MTTRRLILKRLGGALLARPDAPLDAASGMLSAAYIVRRRALAHHRSAGMALHPGNRWAPFDEQQPFRLASVSKMVCTFAFMTLIARGLVDLDADVSMYLGAPLRHPAFPEIPITARRLLSHTSGLRNGIDFPVPFNQALLSRLDRAANEPDFGDWFAPANETPGEWFAYSDTNFAVIAQIAERATAMRFDRFMRETLFAPLRLEIGYNWSGVSQRKRARAVAGCRWTDGAWTAQVDANPPAAPEIAFYRAQGDAASTEADYTIGTNGFAFAPHGGLRLSLLDMDALARRFLRTSGAVNPMRTPAWILAPDTPNGASENGFYQAYGLGMQIPLGRPSDSFFGADSADWRGHCGDAYGWMTGMWWNSRTQTTLVYAINGMPENNRTQAARTALTAAEQGVIDRALAEIE
jgi:CubicO group peptidase (beta-lactamase class C family)